MPADVPLTLARAALLDRPLDMALPLTTYHQRQALVWGAQDEAQKKCGVHILDPLSLLWADQNCPAIDGDKPRYHDNNHMTETGNRSLVGLFQPVFESTQHLQRKNSHRFRRPPTTHQSQRRFRCNRSTQ